MWVFFFPVDLNNLMCIVYASFLTNTAEKTHAWSTLQLQYGE